jgi:hypothetical protein
MRARVSGILSQYTKLFAKRKMAKADASYIKEMILKKYKDNYNSLPKGLSNQNFNQYLKEVFHKPVKLRRDDYQHFLKRNFMNV